MKLHTTVLALVAVLVGGLQAIGGEVSIEGVHICCGACVKGVNAAMKDVKGVSAVVAEQDGTIKFQAADDAAVEAGLAALAKGGFHGTATHAGKAVSFPDVKASKEKTNSLAVSGVHLCCGGCYTEATGALKKVAGVTAVESDKKTKTLKISGDGIVPTEVIEALFGAGFHAQVAQ